VSALLAIDVGNTNVVVGAYDKARLIRTWRLVTVHDRTEDELEALANAHVPRHPVDLIYQDLEGSLTDQFRRVVVNLMDNAAEAMEGSLIKEMVITTRMDPQRSVVETEISDTGSGVSPEDREKLFLPYYSTKERGTGLGLAIVSRIVAEHHGSIRVEENQPLGTRFVVELPVKAS